MKFFAVGTIVLVLGALCNSTLAPTGGVGAKGLPKDGSPCTPLVKAALESCRKGDEGGLKESPKVTDLKGVTGSLETPTNDTIKTVERKIFNNTDAMGHDTGNKTVVEKTTETNVKPNGTVSKTTETKVVVDDEGKERGEKSVTESETVTETTADNKTVAQTVDIKKVLDEDGNEVDEEVVIKKELIAKPLVNTTEEEPQKDKDTNLILPKVGAADTGANIIESKLSVSGKIDGLQKMEREEKTKEALPCANTKEVVVKEKEEKLPSKDSIKVKSVESKNVTDKGDGKDVEKETVIEKEVEKNVCSSDIKEVRNEKHLSETIEDLKHQVDDVKSKIKEDKVKAVETNAAPGIQEGKVVTKVISAVTPGKVVEKVVPSVGEGKAFVRVVKQVTPSVEVEKVPVVTQMKVAEKVPPTVIEGKVPAVKEEKVTEKVVPPVTEGILPVVTKEIVEQATPSVTEEIVSVPKEQEEIPVVVEEKGTEQTTPSVTEEIVSVPKEQEVPAVAEKVVERIIPSVTEGKVPVAPQQVVVEKVAPSATESVVSIPKGEERVLERIAPVVKK